MCVCVVFILDILSIKSKQRFKLFKEKPTFKLFVFLIRPNRFKYELLALWVDEDCPSKLFDG